jgi:adenosylhomocysteine nucleosidase
VAAFLKQPETAPAPVILAFALRREARYFWRSLLPWWPLPEAPCPAIRSGRVLMLETGIGQAAASRALEWALGTAVRPRLVVSAGFSGALRSTEAVGDLVLATEVVDVEGNNWAATWPEDFRGPPELKKGRLLCVPELISDPSEKQRLAERHQALAVDMESAALARASAQHGIPFAALRCISDDAQTALSPRLAGLLCGARVSAFRLAGAVARRPGILPQLLRLARDTRTAARVLAQALAPLQLTDSAAQRP